MNRIKIRKLFIFRSINQSDEFDLDKVIPSQHAIWNFERMLAFSGIIITPSDRIQSKKTLAMKCFIPVMNRLDEVRGGPEKFSKGGVCMEFP